MTTAFIVRPFGKKTARVNGAELQIDFDRVEQELLHPVLTRLGITGRTTGEIVESGNIRDDMFALLLTRDLVIADVTIHNANVFYELCIRHALRDRWTFMVRGKGEPMPFDNLTDRYFEYDQDAPGASVDKLVEALRRTLESKGKDSPVFRALPNLAPPTVDDFIAIPSEFGGEVEIAKETRRIGDLLLLANEAKGFVWEVAGLRAVGRALFKLSAMRPASETWTAVLELRPDDAEANEWLGTIYQRLGEQAKDPGRKLEYLTRSSQVLEKVLAKPALELRKRAEIHSLIARNHKAQWRAAWEDKAPGERQEAALGSRFLRDSFDAYDKGFRVDRNHFYPGLNAAAMLTVLVSLARARPKAWVRQFKTDKKAEAELGELDERLRKLLAAVELSLEAARERFSEGGTDGQDDDEIWFEISCADFMCLTLKDRPEAVADAYTRALENAKQFHRDAAAKQLVLYQQLDLMTENVNAALAAINARIQEAAGGLPPRTLLFTGHRVDAPGRAKPRFPSSMESVAKKAIGEALDREKLQAEKDGRTLIGIAGGASGGDILFHEACRERGIPSTLYLVMPRDPFVSASVADSAADWIARFDALASALPKRELMASAELPIWLRRKEGYSIWDRSNLWMLHSAFVNGGENAALIALWDGGKGDGPGGTQHMAEEAGKRGARVIHLDTKALFGLGG